MRINNEVRNFIHTKVHKRAADKLGAIDAELKKFDAKRDRLIAEAEKVAKRLCKDAAAKLDEEMKRLGLTLDGDSLDVIECNSYRIRNNTSLEECNALEYAKKELLAKVNATAEELIVRLSLGADYETIMHDVNKIQFN